MTMVRCCSCIQAIRCCWARCSDSGDMGCPLRVRDRAMFLSGTHKRRERAAHVIQPGLQDEVELVGVAGAADWCDDISSISDKSRSRTSRSRSRDPNLERSASSRRRHSRAGCTSWRTVCSGRASVRCAPDRRPSRLTTPSNSTCSPRIANEYTARPHRGATTPGNSCGSVDRAGDRPPSRHRAHRRDPSPPTPTRRCREPRGPIHP